MKPHLHLMTSLAILAAIGLSACKSMTPASSGQAYPVVPTPVQAYPLADAIQPSDLSAFPYPAASEPLDNSNPDQPVSATPGGSQPQSDHQPWMPRADDVYKSRGNAFVQDVDILVQESFPPGFVLKLTGNLPTPCNELRVLVNPPDKDNKIVVEVYSVIAPDKMCAQVLAALNASVPLIGLSTGKYTVWIDGSQVGEIDVP